MLSPNNINDQDDDGNTILFFSIKPNLKENDLNLIKYLIENGANINIANKIGQTPLMIAISANNIMLSKYLLDRGADINIKNKYGQTPLMLAVESNNPSTVKWLIEKGADVIEKDTQGKSAISYIVSSNYEPSIIDMLLEKNSDLNNQDDRGDTVLSKVVSNMNLVEKLIKKGADINLQNKQGETPLFKAALLGDVEIVKLLLSNNADVNRANINGYTPLKITNNDEIKTILLSSGAKEINEKYKNPSNKSDEKKYEALRLKRDAAIQKRREENQKSHIDHRNAMFECLANKFNNREEKQEETSNNNPVIAICPNCQKQVDVTGTTSKDIIECPYCKARFTTDN